MDKSVEAAIRAACGDGCAYPECPGNTTCTPLYRDKKVRFTTASLATFLDAEAERLGAFQIKDAEISGGLLYCRRRAAELRSGK